MPDLYDLILIEDSNGDVSVAYTDPYAATKGDLAEIDGVLFEIKAIAENVPKAAVNLLAEAGEAMKVEKVYTIAWEEKKGSAQ